MPDGHTYLCRRKAAKARFDNRHSISAPTPTLTAVSGSGASGTSDPPNRHCYPLHFMRECIPPNLHDPQRAKGSLNRRFEWFSLVTFFLQKKKVTRAGARNSPSRARRRSTCLPPGQRPPRKRFFVSDGPISSNSGRNGGKNAGRNCVSALPQRAMPVRCRPRFPSRNRRFPDRCRSPDCASTAFRCRCLLLW